MSLPVQKLSTLEVDRLVEKARLKTQHAYSVCRVFAAILGDCPISTFKACLAAYTKGAEYFSLPIAAKRELLMLLEWRKS
jgi:hypothetical protein